MTGPRDRPSREPCRHPDVADRAQVCGHLAGHVEWGAAFVRWLTGVGIESELLCRACAEAREAGGEVEIVSICEPCHAFLTEEIGDVVGIGGTPGIRIMPAPVDLTIVEKHLEAPAGIVDFAAVEHDPGTWLFVAPDGLVTRVDTASDRSEDVCRIDLPAGEPGYKPWAGHRLTPRLHLSPSGRFAAVVNDYGRNGKVYDLRTGATTATLDGGEYHRYTVPFSCAFVEHDGREIVIHRTAWNRLDASLAGTGELLTGRDPTSDERGEAEPGHRLDYFHGAIVASPDGRRVADDGWVWSPVGIPVAWSVAAGRERLGVRGRPEQDQARVARLLLGPRDLLARPRADRGRGHRRRRRGDDRRRAHPVRARGPRLRGRPLAGGAVRPGVPRTQGAVLR